MKRKFYVSLLCIIISVTCNFILHANINIEITHGLDSAYPIGIIPFKWNNESKEKEKFFENIGDIIATDLRNTRKFNPLSISVLPQKPTSISEIIPSLWKNLGINTIVIGQISSNIDGRYTVSYKLVDISSNSCVVLIQNKIKVNKKWLRYAAHTSSNTIFKTLTGIQGAFCTRIAYITHTDNKYPYELCISDYDGFNKITIYRSLEPLMSPAWSPDGNKIAYVMFKNGKSTLVVQTLDNGDIQTIAKFPQHNGAPAWSPDGKKLAFALSKTGNLNLYVMDMVSGHINQLTNNYNNTEPSWFPDSQTLAYTSDKTGRPQIYKINIYGGIPQRLTWDGTQNQDPDVSTDGKFIAMVNINNGVQHIAKLDLMTGEFQILTNTFLDETPSISPNGILLIYSASQGLNSVLYLVSTDGRHNPYVIIPNGQGKFPVWSPYL